MTRISDQLRSDGRWAWRNLRARGWRASFAIVLLAVALAANAIVFSVADSLVFHRIPYPRRTGWSRSSDGTRDPAEGIR